MNTLHCTVHLMRLSSKCESNSQHHHYLETLATVDHLLSTQDCSVHKQIHFATASKSFLSSQFLCLPWHRVQQAFNNEHGFVSLCALRCSSLFLLHFLPSVVPCWAVTKRANCPQPSTPEQLWPPMLHHPHHFTQRHCTASHQWLNCIGVQYAAMHKTTLHC